MNIKSLLIGSAAALAAVSGAKAADAIVAAEPEPLEYVRVCDAFGAGFFYIPGTETCLKFDGYIRFNVVTGRDASGTSDWDAGSRAQFNIDTRTDTELGALRGYIGFRAEPDAVGVDGTVFAEQAFIELGGLKVGKFYSWWDDDLSSETDVLSTNSLFNSIRYTYDAGSFWAGISVDELEGTNASFVRLSGTPAAALSRESDNNVGITGGIGGKFGAATVQLIGSYDVDQEEGAVRLLASAEIGPGTLGVSGIWASGVNAYYAESEWAAAIEYGIKATDRLTITPAFQYSGNVANKTTGATLAGLTGGGALTGTSTYYVVNDWTNNDEWRAGVTVDYKFTEGLTGKLAATYVDRDGSNEQWVGLARLQRSF